MFVFNALAELASRTRINHVSSRPRTSDVGPITKRRIRGSSLLRFPGNLLFRLRSPSVRVLGTRDWQAWEQLIGGDTPHVDGRGLRLQQLPGTPLSALLAVVEHGPACRTINRARVTAAVKALRELHLRLVDHPHYGIIALSHGDAAVSNVMIDHSSDVAVTPAAVWFDFDVRHDLRAPAVERHADDLRAFLFTAAMLVPPDAQDSLVSIARGAYGQTDVWQALVEQVSARQHGWDLFHRAQCLRSRRHLPGLLARFGDRHTIDSYDRRIIRQIWQNATKLPTVAVEHDSNGGKARLKDEY